MLYKHTEALWEKVQHHTAAAPLQQHKSFYAQLLELRQQVEHVDITCLVRLINVHVIGFYLTVEKKLLHCLVADLTVDQD
jgi:hypothetical protein